MPSLSEEQYGISGSYSSEESELFTPIDAALKTATKRATYQPYFEMFQTSASNSYFNNLSKFKNGSISLHFSTNWYLNSYIFRDFL